MVKKLDKKYHKSRPSWLSSSHLSASNAKEHQSNNSQHNFLIRFYDKNYKKLLVFPLLLLFLALVIIGYKYATTGEMIDRSVSLKGGITLEIYHDIGVSNEVLARDIESNFAGSSVDVGTLKNLDGTFRATTVYASGSAGKEISGKEILDFISSKYGMDFQSNNSYQLNEMESTFSNIFFRQLVVSMLVAFLFMAITVFIIYRVPVPAFAVILSVFADIIETIAVFDIFGITISAASIAAFMMLIGYSVDTDILLSTKVLKQQGGSTLDKILESMKTGFMMIGTAFFVVLVCYLLTQSSVLKEIMLVIMIGTVFDIINTWITNAGLLRMYVERKK